MLYRNRKLGCHQISVAGAANVIITPAELDLILASIHASSELDPEHGTGSIKTNSRMQEQVDADCVQARYPANTLLIGVRHGKDMAFQEPHHLSHASAAWLQPAEALGYT